MAITRLGFGGPGQAYAGFVAKTAAAALDLCDAVAVSLMPTRTAIGLMPTRRAVSLMPARTVEPYCANED